MKLISITLCIKITLISITIFITGCASTTPPEWYTSPKPDTNKYIYAAAQGRSLSHAKKMAINNVNEKLWTQVDSSFYMRDVAKENNGQSTSNNLIDNKINTKTAKLTLNGVEFLNTEENELGFFVEVRVKKELVRKQLILELNQLNNNAQSQLDSLKNSDSLLWWLKNQNAFQLKKDALIRIAMLSVVSPQDKFNTLLLDESLVSLSSVNSSLLIQIKTNKRNKKSASLLSDKFSLENISTTNTYNKYTTHTLTLISEPRKNIIGDAYVSTLVTELKLINKKGKTIASNEIISSGNSVTSYKMANEGASRHFAQQIDDHGLWTSLGITQ
ncbi:LPP20 family lipoprotein [Photobacterium indicum]|uniref:Lipoprotein LPP20-like domain-containing protein n=1 Tax=Photobacterium indicum TaxID=81447 RepID=A0A2T3LA98_9GAMM|nr:LPP20 family lipoprotein [Photobacterium indicum]PSV48231.1 hypothetical protein C9J47_06760 [Photobacterium indicum]